MNRAAGSGSHLGGDGDEEVAATVCGRFDACANVRLGLVAVCDPGPDEPGELSVVEEVDDEVEEPGYGLGSMNVKLDVDDALEVDDTAGL